MERDVAAWGSCGCNSLAQVFSIKVYIVSSTYIIVQGDSPPAGYWWLARPRWTKEVRPPGPSWRFASGGLVGSMTILLFYFSIQFFASDFSPQP